MNSIKNINQYTPVTIAYSRHNLLRVQIDDRIIHHCCPVSPHSKVYMVHPMVWTTSSRCDFSFHTFLPLSHNHFWWSSKCAVLIKEFTTRQTLKQFVLSMFVNRRREMMGERRIAHQNNCWKKLQMKRAE